MAFSDPNSDQLDLNQIIDQVLQSPGEFATGDILTDLGDLGVGIQNVDPIPVLGNDGQGPSVPGSSFRNFEQFIDPNAPPDYEGLPYMDRINFYDYYQCGEFKYSDHVILNVQKFAPNAERRFVDKLIFAVTSMTLGDQGRKEAYDTEGIDGLIGLLKHENEKKYLATPTTSAGPGAIPLERKKILEVPSHFAVSWANTHAPWLKGKCSQKFLDPNSPANSKGGFRGKFAERATSSSAQKKKTTHILDPYKILQHDDPSYRNIHLAYRQQLMTMKATWRSQPDSCTDIAVIYWAHSLVKDRALKHAYDIGGLGGWCDLEFHRADELCEQGLEGFFPLFVPLEDERMTGNLEGLLKLRGEVAYLADQARRSMGKKFRDQVFSLKCNGFINPIDFTAYQLMEANELKTRHLTKQLEKVMAQMDIQTKSHKNEIAGKTVQVQQLKRLFSKLSGPATRIGAIMKEAVKTENPPPETMDTASDDEDRE